MITQNLCRVRKLVIRTRIFLIFFVLCNALVQQLNIALGTLNVDLCLCKFILIVLRVIDKQALPLFNFLTFFYKTLLYGTLIFQLHLKSSLRLHLARIAVGYCASRAPVACDHRYLINIDRILACGRDTLLRCIFKEMMIDTVAACSDNTDHQKRDYCFFHESIPLQF